MGISSVNMAMGASSFGAYNQKLTEATKTKLEELGIPYDSNMTEAQGKAIIQKYQNMKSRESSDKSSLNQNNNPKDFLMERALELAKKLGISVPEQMNLTQVLALIQTELENRVRVNSSNEQELKKLRNYAQELSSLQAQSSGSMGFDSSNKALEMSLEMLSMYNQYNQNFLNK